MFEEELFWMIESGSPFLGRADLLIPNLSSPFSSLETQMFRNEFKEEGKHNDKTEIFKHIPQKENRITRDKTLLTNKDTPTSGEQMPPWLTYTTKETELNILGFIDKKKE